MSALGVDSSRSRTSRFGHLLTVDLTGRTTGSDWLPTFEFGLANDSSCLKRPVRVSGAEGRFTLKLDARQSSSRWQPPALNVDRPTAAFEASELSLSTHRRRRRFSDRLTGVPCHRPFVALVAKIRIQ